MVLRMSESVGLTQILWCWWVCGVGVILVVSVVFVLWRCWMWSVICDEVVEFVCWVMCIVCGS